MTELLPCPFCGAKPAVNFGRNAAEVWAYVTCNCGVRTRNYHGDTDKEVSRKAADAWNTRAQTVFGMTLDEVRQMMKRDAERERTCEVLGEDYDELLEYWETELSCGHVYNGMAQYVNYCPKCGAKVTPKCSETTPKVVDE